jgi:hypothetical protein
MYYCRVVYVGVGKKKNIEYLAHLSTTKFML